MKPPLLLLAVPEVHNAHDIHADSYSLPDGRHVAQRHNVFVGCEHVVFLQRERALRDLKQLVKPTKQCLPSSYFAGERGCTGKVPDHLVVDQFGKGVPVACTEGIRSSPVRGGIRVLHVIDYPAVDGERSVTQPMYRQGA